MSEPSDPSSDPSDDLPHWPGNWPGRTVIDLDNLGDPGWWIDEQTPNVAEVLFGKPETDDALAAELADAYICAARDLDFPLPSDFGLTTEETYEDVKGDFLGFIREWRKRAVGI